jgi:hypothetical protein
MAAIAFAVSGCSHEPRFLSAGALSAVKAKTLLLYTDEKQLFYDGLFGRGALVLAKRRGLIDPAFRVGASLGSALAEAYALDIVTVTQDSPPGAATPVGRRPRVGADLVLDVDTTAWGVWSGPSLPIGRYAVHLEMEVVLTDTRSGTVLAGGTCKSEGPGTPNGHRYDDLDADDGALTKKHLAWAAERCERYFRERILSLPTAATPVASGGS